MILLNALFPVLALILFGAAVKHWRITDDVFSAPRTGWSIMFSSP
jgi:hypothetical protein